MQMTRRELEQLTLEACQTYGANLSEYRAGHRYAECVRARTHVIHTLRQRGYSLPKIGRYMKMHHTSVFAALRRNYQPARQLDSQTFTIPVPDLSGEWAI